MTSEINRCYRALELEPGATLGQVKQAWRELAKVWHPDRFPNDDRMQRKAQERLKEINGAYAILEQFLTSQAGHSHQSNQQSRQHDSENKDTEAPPPRPPPRTTESKQTKPMDANQRTIFACVAAAAVVVISLLWFNRYSFSEMKIGDNTFPVRTSRFSGNSEVFVMGRWTQMGGTSGGSSASKGSSALAPDEIRKIDGRAGIRPVQYVGEMPKYYLNCSVYNGTSVSLAELTVRLEIQETEKQKGFTREYRLRPKNGGVVLPLSNGDFEADIGIEPESGKWSWGIVGASGVR